MERSQLFKFIFILVVAILVIIISLYSFFGGNNQKDEDIEDMFRSNDEEQGTDDEINMDDIDLDLDGEEESNDDEVDEGKDIDDTDDDTSGDIEDMEKHNDEKFGKDNMEKAEENAEIAIEMWLERNDDMKEWERISTPSFLKKIKKEIADIDSVQREVDFVELFALGDEREDELTFESRVVWYYNKDGELYNQQKQMMYVVFEKSDEGLLVSDIMSMQE